MDDLISRQDAIMAVKTGALSAATIYGRTDEGSTALYETVRAIKALPSAQPEPCEDVVPRMSVEYICRKNTVSTNPYEHKYHDKFIQFMDDPEISDFGRWQHSNGFNTALVAVECDLDKVPSAQPQRWIPVTERLPEEKQDVLLAFKHNMVVGFWEDILDNGEPAWYANSGDGWMTGTESVDSDGIPIAWMPLPEPYKEEER